jgi:hypothetical protein
MNKSNPRPPLNTNGKNSKINQVGSPRVELSRITFCDGQIDFSQSGRSGYVTIIPDNQELYFELLAPKPAHGKFKMRSIKALYLSDDEQCPSQLVLEFNESYKATTKTAFRYFTSLFRKLPPSTPRVLQVILPPTLLTPHSRTNHRSGSGLQCLPPRGP